MKIMPDVGCRGGDYHDYSFQTVYRGGPHGPANEIESIIGMCNRCGDIYMQPVTRLERPAEEQEQDGPFFGGSIQWDSVAPSGPSTARSGSVRLERAVPTAGTIGSW